MFGKEQPDVVTDQDVGNFVDELCREGVAEVDTFINQSEEDDNDESKDETSNKE
mgnify:CR=1 FL=1|tara:strand:+ start:6543 stop:6704 length:162 start_codon:yes stop_codon:yes gene_type:complete